MKQHNKFSAEQQPEQSHETRTRAAQEFSNPDELLRFDAAQIVVPPAIADRLKAATTADETISVPARSWWKQLLGQ